MSKIIFVTGANRGLGRKVAEILAGEGHQVIIGARNKLAGQQIADELTEQGMQVFFRYLDLKDPETFRPVANNLKEKFGKLDVLVNNAAIHYDQTNDVTLPDFELVNETLATNLVNTWKLTTIFLPLLKASGNGRIVNVSSGSGSITSMAGGTPAYSISKAGLNVLTIKLAHALSGTAIKVNSVCPGWVRTDMGGPEAPRSLEEGARSIIWTINVPENGPTGGFFRDGKAIDW